MTIADELARFTARSSLADVPAPTVEHAKLLLLDAIGVALAAAPSEFAAVTARSLTALGPGHQPVIGRRERLSMRDAAVMNGVLIHGLDFDDTHLPGVIHTSAPVLPAALAVAHELDSPGRDLLYSYVIGIETAARVAAAAGGAFHRSGFHPTGVVGAFGAALAAAVLKGLDAQQTAQAQGFALSLAAGPMQFVVDGSWTKRVHPGWAAASGITAAEFARNGFESPSEAYEGRHGLFRAFMPEGEAAALAQITVDLGHNWRLRETAIKLYPACHLMHGCLDAAAALAPQLNGETITDIICKIHDDYVPVICEPASRKVAPSGEYEAKFSLQYAVATTVLRGRFTVAELADDALRDLEALALARRVRYESDPSSGYPRHYSGEVVITTAGGSRFAHREQINRGSIERPITRADVEAKFFACAALGGLPQRRAAEIASSVFSLDLKQSSRAFVESLSAPR